ncbi:hypothetical protein HKX48_000957 [Thoreauomyces humboldtii]|nr:hypothetical protein HKX48_000957 [Thoreauomyces humboldtii]
MPAYQQHGSSFSSPQRARSTNQSSHFHTFSTSQLETSYNLAGLEDKECIHKLLQILEGKEKEIEKFKRDKATRDYDATWGRSRNRSVVSATAVDGVERGSVTSDTPSRTDARVVESMQSTIDGLQNRVHELEDTVEDLREKLARAESVEPSDDGSVLRVGEHKLIMVLKKKIKDLEGRLADRANLGNFGESEAANSREAAMSTTKTIELMTLQVHDFDTKLARANAKLKQADESKAIDREKILALQTEKEELLVQITELHATEVAHVDLLNETTIQHQTIETLRNTIGDLQEKLEHAHAADSHERSATETREVFITSLKRKLSDMESEIQEKEAATATLSKNFATERESNQRMIATLKSDIQSLENRASRAEARVAQAEAAAADVEAEKAGLQNTAFTLRTKIQELDLALRKSEFTRTQSSEQLQDHQMELDESKRKIQELERKLAQAENSSVAADKEKWALHESNLTLDTKIRELELSLRTAISAKTMTIDRLHEHESERDRLDRDLQAAEAHVKALEARAAKMETEKAALQSSNFSLTNKIRELDLRAQKAESEWTETETAIETLEGDRNTLQAEVRRITEQLAITTSAAEAEKEELQNANFTLTNKLRELDLRARKAESTNTDVVQEHEAERDHLIHKLLSLEAELNQIRPKLAHAESEITQSEEERLSFQSKLREMGARTKEIEASKASANELIHRHETERGNLERKLNIAEDELVRTKAKLAQVEIDKTESLKETTTLRATVDMKTREIESAHYSKTDIQHELELECETLKQEVVTAETKLERLESRLATLEAEKASVTHDNLSLLSKIRDVDTKAKDAENTKMKTEGLLHEQAAERQSLMEKLLATEIKLEQLEPRLAAAETERAVLEKENLSLRSKIREVDMKAREADTAKTMTSERLRTEEAERESLHQSLLRVQDKLDRTETKLAKADEEKDVLQDDNFGLKKTIRELDLRFKTAESAKTSTQELLRQCEAERDSLVQELRKVQNKLEQSESNLGLAQAQSAALEESNVLLTRRIQDLDSRAQHGEAARNSLTDRLYEHETEREAFVQDLRKMEEKLRRSNDTLVTVQTERDGLKNANSALTSKVRELDDKFQRSEKAGTEKAHLLQEHEMQHASLFRELQACEDRLEHAQRKVADAEEEKVSLQIAASALTSKVREAELRIQKAEIARTSTSNLLHDQESEKEALLQTLHAAEQELERSKGDIMKLDSERQALRSSNHSLTNRIRDLDQELQRAQTAHSKISDTLEEREGERAHLLRQVRDLEARVSDAESVAATSTQALQERETEFTDLNRKVREFEARVEDYRAASTTVEAEKQALRETNASLTNRIRQLDQTLQEALNARSAADGQLNDYELERMALIRELRDMKGKLQQSETAIASIESEKLVSQHSSSQLKNKIRELELELQQAADAKAKDLELVQELEAARTSLYQKVRELEAARQEAEELVTAAEHEKLAAQHSESLLKVRVRDLDMVLQKAALVKTTDAELLLEHETERKLLLRKIEELESALRHAESAATGIDDGSFRASTSDPPVVASLRAKLNALQAQIARADTVAATDRQTALEDRRSYENTLRQLRPRIKELETQLADAKGAAKSELQEQASQRMYEGKTHHKMKETIRDLQRQLASAAAVPTITIPAAAKFHISTQTLTEAGDSSALDIMEQEYEDLRVRIHNLADDIQQSVFGGAPKSKAVAREHPDTPGQPQRRPDLPPFQHHLSSSSGNLNATLSANKSMAISSAFKSLHTVLSHLAERCATSNENAAKARRDLRKTISTLKRARSDVALAEQARTSLVERVKELEGQCKQKMQKLKLLDDLIMGKSSNPPSAPASTEHQQHQNQQRQRRNQTDDTHLPPPPPPPSRIRQRTVSSNTSAQMSSPKHSPMRSPTRGRATRDDPDRSAENSIHWREM